MEGFHHLLELTDTYLGIVRIGRITTLGHVVIQGVITPIVLIITKACLVHRSIVVAGQDMDGIHT